MAFAIGLLGAFLLFWVNGAVGTIGQLPVWRSLCRWADRIHRFPIQSPGHVADSIYGSYRPDARTCDCPTDLATTRNILVT